MARQKAQVKGRAARRAAKTSRAAGQAAVELRAAELAARVRESEPVTKAQALTSEAVAKAQALTSELAGRVREAKLDDRANELADRARTAVREAHLDQRAAELAERARTAVRDAKIDERAAELAARVRESEAGQRATEAAKRTSDQTFERVGSWLVTSGAGERMGVAPAKRRRVPVWLGLLLGVAAGYLAAKLTSRSRDVTPAHDDPFAEAADRLTTPAAPLANAADAPSTSAAPPANAADAPSTPAAPLANAADAPSTSAAPLVDAADPLSTPAEPAAEAPVEPMVESVAPTGPSPLADEIRSSLDADPRTAGLPGLAINVADSTVFVRGSVPEGFDETSIREVVASVPGVTDVDLQVSPA